jgi:hypothetical protein
MFFDYIQSQINKNWQALEKQIKKKNNIECSFILGPQTKFLLLKLILRPAQQFEFDMPGIKDVTLYVTLYIVTIERPNSAISKLWSLFCAPYFWIPDFFCKKFDIVICLKALRFSPTL